MTLELSAGSLPGSVCLVRNAPVDRAFHAELSGPVVARFLRGHGGDLNGVQRLDVVRVRCGTAEELEASAGVGAPTFDENAYPTPETLQRIRQWDPGGLEDLLRFLCAAWHWPHFAAQVRPGIWTFATGGWSGNEDLIAALKDSVGWFCFHWSSVSLPGGLLCIALGDSAAKEMHDFHSRIVTWCWRRDAPADVDGKGEGAAVGIGAPASPGD